MRTNKNIYISDLLSVPMPKHATSHRDFLRRIQTRRILWATLPYLGEGIVAGLCCGGTIVGIIMLTLSLGG